VISLNRLAWTPFRRRTPARVTVSECSPLYSFHIPKTAGMSVYHFLHQRYPPELVCPESLWDELIAVACSRATSYTVYAGHFFGYLDRFLGKLTTKFTLLRDPVERTVSHFCHVRRDPRHPFHETCRSQTLLNFVFAPETQYMAQDFQARNLSTAGADIRAVAQGFSSTALQEFRLQT
jgi:hypothetical protein